MSVESQNNVKNPRFEAVKRWGGRIVTAIVLGGSPQLLCVQQQLIERQDEVMQIQADLIEEVIEKHNSGVTENNLLKLQELKLTEDLAVCLENQISSKNRVISSTTSVSKALDECSKLAGEYRDLAKEYRGFVQRHNNLQQSCGELLSSCESLKNSNGDCLISEFTAHSNAKQNAELADGACQNLATTLEVAASLAPSARPDANICELKDTLGFNPGALQACAEKTGKPLIKYQQQLKARLGRFLAQCPGKEQ